MFFSQSFAPEKDERGGVKLDVNNLLSVGSLSRTLDRDPWSESSPQVFHHSDQRQLVNATVNSEDKRKGPLPCQQGDRAFFGRHCWKEGERYLLGHNSFRSNIETQMLKLKLKEVNLINQCFIYYKKSKPCDGSEELRF